MTMRARMQRTAAMTAPAPPPASALEATRGWGRGVSSSQVRSAFCLQSGLLVLILLKQLYLQFPPVAAQALALSSLTLIRVLEH